MTWNNEHQQEYGHKTKYILIRKPSLIYKWMPSEITSRKYSDVTYIHEVIEVNFFMLLLTPLSFILRDHLLWSGTKTQISLIESADIETTVVYKPV